MVPQFSPIQNHIFSRLKNAKLLRYSEIKPENVPNDLFNYHLQFLVKKEYVNRTEEGYSLSQLGLKHIADFNPQGESISSTHLFKVNVITVVSRLNKGKVEILQQKRTSNPSYGKIGVMGGIVRKGESIEDAATRKLKEETGLDAKLTVKGIQRRMMYVKGELFSDVFFPVAYADEYEGTLIAESEYGHNMWVPIEEAIQNDSAPFDSIKGIIKVLTSIRDKSVQTMPFFYHEDTQNGEVMG